jgi:DNA-binding Lrp family transcriptional regulator
VRAVDDASGPVDLERGQEALDGPAQLLGIRTRHKETFHGTPLNLRTDRTVSRRSDAPSGVFASLSGGIVIRLATTEPPMAELDDVDRGILHQLQQDARNTTAQAIADEVGVSPSTVRNRIDRLETLGVIEGYYPEINYEAADLPLQVLFVCTAPAEDRSGRFNQLLTVRGVVDVRETMTGRGNLFVEVAADDTSDIVRITDAIQDLGFTIDSSEFLRRRRIQPFNHFYPEPPTEDDGE